ncbi:MAG: hypothetical protein JNK58_00860 [Phycisphaerae bacterium]|nr:hypothetical protein [Phycisphaerae bacterium]
MLDERANGVAAPAESAGVLPRGAEVVGGRGSVLCPYCGHIQSMTEQCERCRGLFEPLSRQATQNQMGPWQLRSEKQPFGPGFSYEKLKEMVSKGRVTRATVLRGPSTKQFWSLACNAPGVAVLLGECHNCHSHVQPDEYLCRTCSAVLTCSTDRQYLGLGPVKLLPGDGPAHEVASSAANRSAARPAVPLAASGAVVAAASAATVAASEGVSIAARRRARRDAEAIRAMIAVAVVLAVITVTVITIVSMRSGDAAAGVEAK